MYEKFYGFREKPFSLLPDAGFLYLSAKHRMALTLLEYGLMNQAGFTVISGDIGTGKTTLIRQVLNTIDPQITVGLISNTHRTFGELMQWIALAFDLPHQGKDKVQLYHDFMAFIIGEYAQGRRTVLIVDEAQNMSAEALEELRMLSNVNADKDQVLQVILVGQRELRDTLRRPDLVQFAQRIGVDYHLDPLTEEETSDYIRHRCKVAGGQSELFSDQARQAVFEHTGGVPRLVNLLCDTALVYGYAEQRDRIDATLVNDVARDKQAGGLFPGRGGTSEPEQTAAPEPVEPAAPVVAPSIGSATGRGSVIGPEQKRVIAPERIEPGASGVTPSTRSTTGRGASIEPPQKPVATPGAVEQDAPVVSTSIGSATSHRGRPAPVSEATPAASPRGAGKHPPKASPGASSDVLRVAIAADSELLRTYLSKLLSKFDIRVVAALPLNSADLSTLDEKNIDVLLVELCGHLDRLDEAAYKLFEKWRKPVLFNDGVTTEASLSKPNRLEYVRELSQKLYALAPQAPQSVA